MPQPLFQAKQHRLLIQGLGVDDAVGMESRSRERRCEQVARAEAPEDGALHPGEHAGDEKQGRGTRLRAAASIGGFMESAARQAAPRQAGVDCGDPERHDRVPRSAHLWNAGNPSAQLVENARVHISSQGQAGQDMFLFCS